MEQLSRRSKSPYALKEYYFDSYSTNEAYLGCAPINSIEGADRLKQIKMTTFLIRSKSQYDLVSTCAVAKRFEL